MYNAALVMAEQLKAVGINAELHVVDWPTSVQSSRPRTSRAGTSSSPATARSPRSARWRRCSSSRAARQHLQAQGRQGRPGLHRRFERHDQRQDAGGRARRRSRECSRRMLEQVYAVPFGALTKVQARARERGELQAVPHPAHVQRLARRAETSQTHRTSKRARRSRRDRVGEYMRMGRYILAAAAQSIPVLLLVSLISFGMMQLVPGDPAVGHRRAISATPSELDADPPRTSAWTSRSLCSCWRWYGGLLQGDLGHSLLLGKPVLSATLRAAAGDAVARGLCAGRSRWCSASAQRHHRGAAAATPGSIRLP